MAFIYNICFLLSYVQFALSFNTTSSDHWSLFQKFIKHFDKKYPSIGEFKLRFDIFKDNIDYINNANSNKHKYTLGVTRFSDLTPEEFSNSFGLAIPTFGPKCETYKYSHESTIPDQWDWRDHNAVTSVKDQGQCGSCWSFSATGAIEGAWARTTGKMIDLSEQQLVDCAGGRPYGNHGCNGGLMDGAFEYVTDNGLCSDESYPYTSGTTKKTGTCEETCKPVVTTLNTCYDVTPNNELHLKEAVSSNPVSVAIEADTRVFQLYTGGIITSEACGTNLDHGVLVVGYGEEDDTKYWIVKNSWSASWGENGYVRIERSDSENDKGICGIAMQPSLPVV